MMPNKLAVITDPARLLEHKPIDTEWFKNPYKCETEMRAWMSENIAGVLYHSMLACLKNKISQ